MMTSEKPKRRWTPWYKLPVVPLCPIHGVACIARSTLTTSGGESFQRRYCPVDGCSHSMKTAIPRE